MKLLAIEQDIPGVSAIHFTPQLKKAEAARVWELYQAGVFRELYFRQDAANAVLVLECADAESARIVLETLPLVKAGLIAFEIIPLIAYPGFSRLFVEENKEHELL
ncbi:MAG: superoxide dismutase [Anaerolineae bacterium]|nr:superoxide dismutase [Anaerolineae bacterium]